jgi:hypothetical protein
MFKAILLVFCILTSMICVSQTLITEIDLKKQWKFKELQCRPMGENIFLYYEIWKPIRDQIEYYTVSISPDGKINSFEIPQLHEKYIAAITNHDDKNYFYYFNEEKKNIILRVVERDFANNKTVLSQDIPVEDNLLGYYTSEDDLFIASFEKKNKYVLKISQIHRLSAAETKSYNLSVDLSTLKISDIAFIEQPNLVGAEQAQSKVKILCFKDEIIVMVDDPFDQHKTTITRINTQTGLTNTMVFTEARTFNFRSFIFDNYLFRTLHSSNSIELQIFSLTTGELLNTTNISLYKSLKEKHVYFKEGRSMTISDTETLFHMIKGTLFSNPFLTVENEPVTGQFIITWGTYYDNNGIGPSVGLTPLLAFVSFVAITAAKQLSDGPGISRYFYMKGNPVEGFNFIEGTKLVNTRERVDQFEIMRQNSGVRYESKQYIKNNDATFGIYYEADTHKITLYKF